MCNLVILLVSFSLLYTCAIGQLVEVRAAVCPTDTAVYRCTNSNGSFLDWQVALVSGESVSSLFFQRTSPAGTVRNVTVGSSSVIFNVTAGNVSFISITLTILDPVSLNGTSITCKTDTLKLDVISANNNALPTELRISRNGSSTIMINPNHIGNSIYYLLSPPSHNDTSSWLMLNEESVIMLSTPIDQLTFSSICNGSENRSFTIGSCIYQDTSQEQNYILQLDGNWIIFQRCPNNSITCIDGRWSECNNSITTEATSMTDTTEVDTTFINTSSQSETDGNVTQNGSSYIYWIIPIAVIIVISLIVAIIIVVIWNIRKKKTSIKVSNPAELSEVTYQQLSNKHQNNRTDFTSRPRHTTPTNVFTQEEYSTLHHNTPPSVPSREEYDTVSNTFTSKPVKRDIPEYGTLEGKKAAPPSHHSNGYSRTQQVKTKSKNLNYADVNAPGLNGHVMPELCTKVDYTDIQLGVRPQDKTLNLDALLVQLRPISDKYKLFGSVAGISPVTLDKIAAHTADPYDGLVEVCDSWLEKCRKEKTPPTWSAVAEILSLIGQKQLSQDIMKVYSTGKLPIDVDMNSMDIPPQGARSSPSPPPLPPHRDEASLDTGSEVELMTVKSIITSKHPAAASRCEFEQLDPALDKPPPIPDKSSATTPESAAPPIPPYNPGNKSAPPLPLKDAPPAATATGQSQPHLPPKMQPRKPQAKKEDNSTPSLPPRPPKNTK